MSDTISKEDEYKPLGITDYSADFNTMITEFAKKHGLAFEHIDALFEFMKAQINWTQIERAKAYDYMVRQAQAAATAAAVQADIDKLAVNTNG